MSELEDNFAFPPDGWSLADELAEKKRRGKPVDGLGEYDEAADVVAQAYLDATRSRVGREREFEREVAIWQSLSPEAQERLERLVADDDAKRALQALRGGSANGRVVSAEEFIFGDDQPVVLIGDGSQALWMAGEPFMIAAPPGVGKSTLAIEIVLRRAGLVQADLLGMHVEPAQGIVLYIAADRPRQIKRLMQRRVTEKMREKLGDRLIVWPAPPPFDLGQCERGQFVEWLRSFGDVSDVVVDSLKDHAVGLSSDEVGAKVNSEYQLALAEGYELLTLQHTRKAQTGNPKPNKLDDIYGSTWIAAGHGSIILLWGRPESSRLELSHLKPPAEPIGPLDVLVDRSRGTVEVASKKTDLVELVGELGEPTALEAAKALHGEDPSNGQKESVRSKLNKRVKDGLLVKVEGDPIRYAKPGSTTQPKEGQQ